MGIVEEIKESFKKGSMLTKLIYINLAVFIGIKILQVFFFLFHLPGNTPDTILHWLTVPADLKELARRPWTVLTYMFLHVGFIHILFNILWLYWMGKIFLRYLDGKKLLSVYILGGLSGAFLFIFSFNVLPSVDINSVALGASAAVMAIIIATATYAPDFTIHLMFIGPVKLKWLAVASIVMDIILMTDGNEGGHIAHLGGALYGYLYITQLKKGKDIARGFNSFMDSVASFFKPKKNLKVTYKKPVTDIEYNAQKVVQQKEVDRILDKIAKAGYESLSKKEKEILFNMSNKNN